MIIHSYYMMFSILSTAFYEGGKDLDDALAPLCGVMDPNSPFSDGPADIAIYNDWVEFSRGLDITEKNILELTIRFCKYLDWGINKTISFLENSFTPEMLKKALSEVAGKGN